MYECVYGGNQVPRPLITKPVCVFVVCVGVCRQPAKSIKRKESAIACCQLLWAVSCRSLLAVVSC